MISIFGARTVLAAEWEVTPTLGVAQGYSDNILLAPSGSEEGESVTQIIPGIVVTGSGRGFEASINYALFAEVFYGDSSRNEAFSRLESDARVPIAGDVFGVDAFGSISQEIVDPTAQIPFTLLGGSANLTALDRLGVSPFIELPFGNGNQFLVRYTGSRNNWDDPTLTDTKSRTALTSLNNYDGERRFLWGLDYRDEKIDFDSGSEFALESGRIELGFRVAAQTRLSLRSGRETVHFVSLLETTDFDEPIWDVGIVREIGEQSSFELRVGERSFGDTARLNLVRRGDRLGFSFSYSEEPTTYGFQSDFGQAFEFGPDATLRFPALDRFVEALYINERFATEISWETRRTDFGIGGYSESRNYIEEGTTDEVSGALAFWRWNFAPYSRFVFELMAESTQFSVIGGASPAAAESERARVEVAYERTLGRLTELRVALARAKQQGDPQFEYDENTLVARIWFKF